ncbi:unnamed protein product [Cyclocybe aegerita]|uniref:Uncharacterized protein n=1 Tax=Cyclocybe aegerita TaxID=1973307 RepID=A0A8S0WGL9_CYCAE|nr:unnamed protein product [Cyclocybe aegerita]
MCPDRSAVNIQVVQPPLPPPPHLTLPLSSTTRQPHSTDHSSTIRETTKPFSPNRSIPPRSHPHSAPSSCVPLLSSLPPSLVSPPTLRAPSLPLSPSAIVVRSCHLPSILKIAVTMGPSVPINNLDAPACDPAMSGLEGVYPPVRVAVAIPPESPSLPSRRPSLVAVAVHLAYQHSTSVEPNEGSGRCWQQRQRFILFDCSFASWSNTSGRGCVKRRVLRVFESGA